MDEEMVRGERLVQQKEIAEKKDLNVMAMRKKHYELSAKRRSKLNKNVESYIP